MKDRKTQKIQKKEGFLIRGWLQQASESKEKHWKVMQIIKTKHWKTQKKEGLLICGLLQQASKSIEKHWRGMQIIEQIEKHDFI